MISMIAGNVVYAKEEHPVAVVSEKQQMVPRMIVKRSLDYFKEGMEDVDTYLKDDEETKVVPEEPKDTTQYPKIYPERFYLTDVNGKNYVSPVKLQNPWGTCWAFAAIAAAETSIMYESDTHVTKENPNPLDLSEKQLAWFSYIPLEEDYENNQGGEGSYSIDEEGNITRDQNIIYNHGGLLIQAQQLFTSAIGPVMESVVPYRPAEVNESNYLEYAAKDIEGTPYFWKNTGDWSVPDEMRQYYSYSLEETRSLPSSAGNNQEGVLAMKEELLSGRPIWIGYHADVYMPSDDMKTAEGEYIYVNEGGQCSHYTYKKDEANHAVTVVGYNDAFSRDNFLEGHRPPGDGAWLVKNSWGVSEKYGTFPNVFPEGFGNDGSGFFWLSYYDKSIMAEQTLNFDLSEDTMQEEARFVCEYDLLPSADTEPMSMNTDSSYANVFVAEDHMNLEETGVVSMEKDSQITVSLYRLNKDAKNPTDGVLLETVQKSYPYPGFHKITLQQKHGLKKGQRFSVVVTEQKNDLNYLPIHYAGNQTFVSMINEHAGEQFLKYFNVGVVNQGESYTCIDGVWSDYCDTIAASREIFRAAYGIPEGLLAIDNFPIKAYGKEIE